MPGGAIEWHIERVSSLPTIQVLHIVAIHRSPEKVPVKVFKDHWCKLSVVGMNNVSPSFIENSQSLCPFIFFFPSSHPLRVRRSMELQTHTSSFDVGIYQSSEHRFWADLEQELLNVAQDTFQLGSSSIYLSNPARS
jgi:hypothetical protein